MRNVFAAVYNYGFAESELEIHRTVYLQLGLNKYLTINNIVV